MPRNRWAVAKVGASGMPATGSLTHDHVLELPGIGRVDIFREQAAAVVEWRPVAVRADHRTKIWLHDAQDAFVVESIGLHHTAPRILDRPDHSRQHSRCDLERC